MFALLALMQKGCYIEADLCCVLWQVEEAKQELKDIVEFLKDPEKFTSLGAKLPKGALGFLRRLMWPRCQCYVLHSRESFSAGLLVHLIWVPLRKVFTD